MDKFRGRRISPFAIFPTKSSAITRKNDLGAVQRGPKSSLSSSSYSRLSVIIEGEREKEREREHNNASRNIQPDVTASVASLSPRVKLQGCHRSVSSCPSEVYFSLNDCEASSSIRRKSMENGGFNS